MRHSILILIPWFGPWPEWMNFFVESCRANRTIDWLIVTDGAPPENRAPNLRYLPMSFAAYKAKVSEALGIRFDPAEPYKLCDIRPALGEVHADLVRGYDFFGFGDLDVIYGDIRATYDADALDLYDALSSHSERVSGHFFLMRNCEAMRSGFRRVPGWRRRMEAADYTGFDEAGFHALFRGRKAKLLGMIGKRPPRCLFREAYTTPVATDAMRWYWRDGRLTNEYYPHRDFLYLHFMSWRSSRWYASHPHIAPGAEPPWSRLEKVVQMDWREAREKGFMISPSGIQPIAPRRYG
ncbi:MAG: DUF6625 family protein [Allosphingosinicella sp.]